MAKSRRIIGTVASVALATLLLGACGGGDEVPAEGETAASGEVVSAEGAAVLLEAQSLTALDQAIAYPKKKQAQISSEIEVLEPGQESGWRKYRVPVYVHVLEGTLSVEYDAGVVKEFPAGTSFLQARGVWHNVSNKGDARADFLTVTMGAKGVVSMEER
ncbi:MAG TPA: hypothetical protein DCQ36_03645 [Actinobacteria bacterium]|jgi:quercetin dioxygenase-like cupin family protein|nr:hypothetical protein [Actinomycetota bacterium]